VKATIWVIGLALEFVVISSAYGADRNYTLTPINAEMWGPVDINNHGDVLIERQLSEGASPAPLIINKNGKETRPFECPSGDEPSTEGSAFNNLGDVVGTCGGLRPFGFVANLKSGSVNFLYYPGALATWGFGINDSGQVVGLYENQPEPPFCCFLPPRHLHSYLWDKSTGEYRTIDHPFSIETGWPTVLTGINNKGQIVGYHYDERLVSFGTYHFVYDNGMFTPVRHPKAWGEDSTYIYGFNNHSQIFGAYSGPGCGQCLFFYDGIEYFDVSLPLPDNAPYPNGMIVFPASAFNFAGLNDNGQFVGTYQTILEWGPDPFHPGEFAPTKTELVNFIATPQKVKPPKPGKGKKEIVN
jgi:hypothetical protein